MIYIASLSGFFLYVGYVWFVWSNKIDAGKTDHSFLERLHLERQELVATFIGACIFMFGGEGVLDSVCDIIGYVFNDNANDLCISIQVNMEALSYIIGGAAFGSVLLWLVKFMKKKASDKLS